MTPYQPDENTGFESLLHQRKLLSSLGNAGIPQQNQPSQPDLTVHVQHSVNAPPTAQPTPQVSAPSGGQPGQFDPNQEAALQTGVAPGPNAFPPKDPIPKVGPINPSMKNPAESAYVQALQNEPMHANYHPSGARKFAGVMGGIGAAFASGGSLRAGIGVGEGIENAPYNKQHQDWKQFAGNKAIQATEEAANDTTTGKAATDASLIAERYSVAAKNNKETGGMRDTADQIKDDKIAEAQGHLKVDTREAKMLDGTIKHLVQRNGLFFDPETGARIDRSAIDDISDEGKSLKETKAGRLQGNLLAGVQAKQIKTEGVGGPNHYDQATVDAATEFDKHLSEGKDPANAEARIIFDRNKERASAGKPPLSSKEEQDLHERFLTMQRPAQIPAMVEDSGKIIQPKAGDTMKPGTRTVSGASSEEVMSHKDALAELKAKQQLSTSYDSAKKLASSGSSSDDYAFLMQYLGATKPEGLAKMRLNKGEIDLSVSKTRGLLGDVNVLLGKLQNGAILDKTQKNEMLKTMKILAGREDEPDASYVRDPKTNKLVLQ